MRMPYQDCTCKADSGFCLAGHSAEQNLPGRLHDAEHRLEHAVSPTVI